MNKPAEVIIIDYGLGNLFSLSRAIEVAGARPIVSSDPSEIAKATSAVLPGVGAFESGMRNLEDRGLVSAIEEIVSRKVPFLGICLGMQLLFEHSSEMGEWDGLGVLPGNIGRIPTPNPSVKIPHIGWSHVSPTSNERASLMNRASSESTTMYFLHSYIANEVPADIVTATASYGGNVFPAIVQSGNTYGVQFHPERSGSAGLGFLKNFIEMSVVNK